MKEIAVEWLIKEIKANDWWYLPESMKQDIFDQAKEIEKEQMIGFHKWMLENDIEANAETFFGYSDTDMLNEYLKAQKL